MGLTKQYLRYSPCGTFNMITSPECNSVWVTLQGQEGRFVAVGACEEIIVWDIHLGEKALVIPGEDSVVTFLACCPTNSSIAAGYKNGLVKTFDLDNGENVAIFAGHKSMITSLVYDADGHRLASGSKDKHVLVWDVVAECGLCRLVSHTGPVTCLSFMSEHNILISSSKDTCIKFWDLDTEHCFKTLLGHRTEVWGFVLMRNDEYLVTGSSDSELRVWHLKFTGIDAGNIDVSEKMVDNDDDNLSLVKCSKYGSILRSGTGRVISLTTDINGEILAVHGNSDTLELFSFCSYLEAIRRSRKRIKKEKKNNENNENVNESATTQNVALQDIVRRMSVVKTKGKIKSNHLLLGKSGELRILLSLNNNTLELFTMDTNEKNCQAVSRRKITHHGHHSEVRALAFSSDNLGIVSGSSDNVKIWNRPSLTCLRTVSTGYVLTLCFVPGDRHVVAGMKNGQVYVLDISAGDVLEVIDAHEKEVWAVCLYPNQRGVATCSGDATVKFWDFELVDDKDSNTKAKVLSLLHRRTLKVDDSVLCGQISPNSKLIAVGLLDMTVKVYFMDTMKFFLNLYGHKLPVTCLDISTDSSLIVTGSADRNIKIWGLDFGDCHRSLFAHDDTVTSVRFLHNTHYFFSCGKDGKVKQWDGDRFEKIITLDGHYGEAWCLSCSPDASYVVSSGSDRVLRLFNKTDEPLVLEDEAEEERAREENNQLVTGDETVVKGRGALNLPSRKTVSSEQAAELLLESLSVCKSYTLDLSGYELLSKKSKKKTAVPTPPPLMIAYNCKTPDEFLMEILRRIRPSDLEECLLLLPYPSVCDLLEMLPGLLAHDYEVELVIKTLLFLLRVHHSPIINNQTLLPVIRQVTTLAFDKLNNLRDLVGYNLHCLQFLHRDIEQRRGVQLFRDATIVRKDKAKKKKRKEKALQRAILTL